MSGPSRMISRDCRCGGRPVWKTAQGRPGGHPKEELVCTGCGNRVGPEASRQTLAAEWNIHGWSKGTRQD